MPSTIHRRITSFLVVLVCLVVSPDADAAKKIRFKGQPILRANSRLTLMPQKSHGSVAVIDEVLSVFIVLPYSETWVFETSKDGTLRAEDEKYLLTVAAQEGRDGTEKEYLEVLLGNLSASAELEIRNVDFKEINGEVLLRYQSRPAGLSEELAKLETWIWNYWSVVGTADARVDLHLSIRAPMDELSPADGKLQVMLGAGFRAKAREQSDR